MLKRQRPASPPLPSSSVPLISDPVVDLIERHSKRRRTLPPVLDGASRGWAKPEENHYDDEDAYYSDHEIDNDAPPHSHNHHKSEYKSTNTLLRELHTLHQHRLLFSSPHAPQTAPSIASSYPSHATSHANHPSPTKSLLPPQHERLRMAQSSLADEKGLQIDGSFSEVGYVTERYENTNKLLGSLFLSRRRELGGSSNDILGT